MVSHKTTLNNKLIETHKIKNMLYHLNDAEINLNRVFYWAKLTEDSHLQKHLSGMIDTNNFLIKRVERMMKGIDRIPSIHI